MEKYEKNTSMYANAIALVDLMGTVSDSQSTSIKMCTVKAIEDDGKITVSDLGGDPTATTSHVLNQSIYNFKVNDEALVAYYGEGVGRTPYIIGKVSPIASDEKTFELKNQVANLIELSKIGTATKTSETIVTGGGTTYTPGAGIKFVGSAITNAYNQVTGTTDTSGTTWDTLTIGGVTLPLPSGGTSAGVRSIDGKTGTFAVGDGISVVGTAQTITNTGVLKLGNKTGEIGLNKLAINGDILQPALSTFYFDWGDLCASYNGFDDLKIKLGSNLDATQTTAYLELSATDTTYTAGSGINIDSTDNNKISNTGVLSLGDLNGNITVGTDTGLVADDTNRCLYINTSTIATHSWVTGQNYSSVSVSSTGTSTNLVNYITVDGTEYKLAGGTSAGVQSLGGYTGAFLLNHLQVTGSGASQTLTTSLEDLYIDDSTEGTSITYNGTSSYQLNIVDGLRLEELGSDCYNIGVRVDDSTIKINSSTGELYATAGTTKYQHSIRLYSNDGECGDIMLNLLTSSNSQITTMSAIKSVITNGKMALANGHNGAVNNNLTVVKIRNYNNTLSMEFIDPDSTEATGTTIEGIESWDITDYVY